MSARDDAPARGPRFLPRRPEGNRLHPVTPWRRAWAPLAALLAFVVHDAEQAREWSGQLTAGWLVLGLLALLAAGAAYGFLTWWCTSYLVTDTELRIHTGLLFRRTAHIRLDRIQAIDIARPLLARVAGVAKLKLDAVGTEAKDELAYLGEREAVALRAELLARAAGIAPDAAPQAGEAPARELLRVPLRTLVLSVLLRGTAWGMLAALLIVPAAIWLATDSVWPALASALPLAGGFWTGGVGRVLREFDWTVAESPDGLRLDSGLLDRQHATVPPGRVQAVRIVEPLLWRRRRWVRVELEVAGAGGSDDDDERGGVLIPVAPWQDAAEVLARVLPGVDLDAAVAATRAVPRRARWCAPLVRRGYGHGVTPSVFVARHGLLTRRTGLVPHGKVQSVRLTQGPWERRHRLADVWVDHGANGQVCARLRDEDEARALLAAQAERSRTGRRTATPERWLTAHNRPTTSGPERSGTSPEQAGTDPEGSGTGPKGSRTAPEPSGMAPEGSGTDPEPSSTGPERSGTPREHSVTGKQVPLHKPEPDHPDGPVGQDGPAAVRGGLAGRGGPAGGDGSAG
ncbi:PH domain-containing protein [Streptomyces albus]|uniref:PH domain-containing protein n=1 Tax=Streptomyces albus TaxID=1888 RepID=UPI0006E1CFD3|nr:PH domain-containing protein [Streptomyces albus]